MKTPLNDPYFGSKLSVRERMEKEAAMLNTETGLYWYNRLVEIALNGIKWEGLPKEIDPRYLELTLLYCGSALFFYDDIGGFAVWRWNTIGRYNHYREPLKRQPVSDMGKPYRGEPRTITNSVIIYNNMTRTPDIVALRHYSRKIAAIDRAIDVNVACQKTAKMVLCSEEQRLVFENLIKKYDGNMPFIFGSKSLRDLGAIETLDTSTPFVANDLAALKRQVIAEAMTYFGVENSSSEKKERLVSDEVTSNLGAVEMARQCRLNAREQACDLINIMYRDILTKPVRVRYNAPTIELSANDPEEVM